MYGRWLLTIILGLCWLLVAAANVVWLRLKFKAKGTDHWSPVAVLGALFAVGALAACPWENPHKWALIIPAMLLDFGSAPLVLLTVGAVIGQAVGNTARSAARGYFNGIERRVARASLIIRIGVSFLLWYVLVGGALAEPGWTGKILAVVAIAYWPVLSAWFWRLRRYSRRGKKP
jgi:hypothetical protein